MFFQLPVAHLLTCLWFPDLPCFVSGKCVCACSLFGLVMDCYLASVAARGLTLFPCAVLTHLIWIICSESSLCLPPRASRRVFNPAEMASPFVAATCKFYNICSIFLKKNLLNKNRTSNIVRNLPTEWRTETHHGFCRRDKIFPLLPLYISVT